MEVRQFGLVVLFVLVTLAMMAGCATSPSSAKLESEAWQRAVASNTAEGYRSFLDAFPSSTNAVEAKVRVEQLTPLSIDPLIAEKDTADTLTVVATKAGKPASTLSVRLASGETAKVYTLDSAGMCQIDLQTVLGSAAQPAAPQQFCLVCEIGPEKAEQWVSVVFLNSLPGRRFLIGEKTDRLPEWFIVGNDRPGIQADRMYTTYPQTLYGIGCSSIYPSPGSTLMYSLFRIETVYWEGAGLFKHNGGKPWVIVQ